MLKLKNIFLLVFKTKRLESSEEISRYWNQRYISGGTSGEGSYGLAALHKADVINSTIAKFKIKSVVDFGCGDGNQLSLLRLEGIRYLGLDVSSKAIEMCMDRFNKSTFEFRVVENFLDCEIEKADLALSMDVLYHLTVDEAYFSYLDKLCNSARYVLIYSMNFEVANWSGHSRPRKFSIDIQEKFAWMKCLSHQESPVLTESGMEYYLYQNLNL